jgi:hypothetical protein
VPAALSIAMCVANRPLARHVADPSAGLEEDAVAVGRSSIGPPRADRSRRQCNVFLAVKLGKPCRPFLSISQGFGSR